MKHSYFLLFTFCFLLSISCRNRRKDTPKVLVYTQSLASPSTGTRYAGYSASWGD